jgi:ABC-2 type transport system permease protein
MLAIYKKEIKSYFISFIGYVFLIFFWLSIALFFSIYNVGSQIGSISYALDNSLIVFLILIPIVTMRLFSQETRERTDQLLYTAPVSVAQIVLGKFFAAISLFLIGMASISFFPIVLFSVGALPVAETIGVFVGFAFLTSCLISVGIFVSSMTSSQISAAISTFGSLFLIFMADSLADLAPKDGFSALMALLFAALIVAFLVYLNLKSFFVSGILLLVSCAAILAAYYFNVTGETNGFENLPLKIISWFSLVSRFQNFAGGIFNASDMIYYISFSAMFLFLTIHRVEKRRWS